MPLTVTSASRGRVGEEQVPVLVGPGRGAGEARRDVGALPEGHRLLGPVVGLDLGALGRPGVRRRPRAGASGLLGHAAARRSDERQDGECARGVHRQEDLPQAPARVSGCLEWGTQLGDARSHRCPAHDPQPLLGLVLSAVPARRLRAGHRLVRTREQPGPLPAAAAGGRRSPDRLVRLERGRAGGRADHRLSAHRWRWTRCASAPGTRPTPPPSTPRPGRGSSCSAPTAGRAPSRWRTPRASRR